MKMKYLDDCFDFNIIDNKIFVWSTSKIYMGDVSLINSVSGTLTVSKLGFEMIPLLES